MHRHVNTVAEETQCFQDRKSCFKMNSRTGFILILLGVFFKVSSGANSTQVYYLEVQIEEGVYKNFTDLIRDLTLNVNNSATVRNISITTECSSRDTGTVNCICNSGYSWSEEVCQNYTECCNRTCTFNIPNPRAMCLSDNRVFVNGSFTISRTTVNLDSSNDYQGAVQTYTDKLESVYSTLDWFESLEIISLRYGSIIGDFVMQLTAPFTVAQFEDTASRLEKNINATFSFIITGMTKISPSSEIIPYDTTVNLTCHKPKDLTKPTWSIKKDAQPSKIITNGTEATVSSTPEGSNVSINKTSENWKGTITCDYNSDKSASIIYRASRYLDIALLPQIISISNPQFPSCRTEDEPKKITVQCIVPNTTENYTVVWDRILVNKGQVSWNGLIFYKGTIDVFCTPDLAWLNVTCTFENRKQQKKNSTLSIPIIQKHSTVCPADDAWPQAMASFTAIKLCDSTTVGLYKRNCTSNGIWGDVISECVTRGLKSLLNDALDLQRGLGIVKTDSNSIFDLLKQSTENISTFPNVNASVEILYAMYKASDIQQSLWNDSVLTDFVKSSSNLLNGNLNNSWRPVDNGSNLAVRYLKAVEGIIKQTHIITTPATDQLQQDNVQILIYNKSDPQEFSSDFGVSVNQISSNMSVQTAIKNLDNKLPKNENDTILSGVILSVIADNGSQISMTFNQKRLPNHEMYCVYWDEKKSQWSDEGCEWGGVDKPNECTCKHLSAFTILMAKEPISLPFMEELTYAGLGFSVVSLALGLIIEFLVWNAVVKTNIAHFRHTVLVNIMVCLLIADCSFLAAPVPSSSPSNWCLSLTVMKHFCYLAVFFWMLCLSLGLLHQVIFVFVHLRKKVYLGLCVFLGYVCPLVIVLVTFITFDNGRTGSYYSNETCWLIYEGTLKGSIHAFVFPVYVIVFLNMFTMVVVISRILKPTLSEGSSHDEKEVARSIIKTVVLLTPTLGITWILGLFVLMLDLTKKPHAQIVNYAFTIFNSFQGFFILLTGCFGEQKVRDALLKRFSSQQSVNYKSESSTKVTSATKRK